VNISIEGQPQWNADDKIVVTMPTNTGGLTTQGSGVKTAVITVMDRFKRGVGVLYSAVEDVGQTVLDIYVEDVEALGEVYGTRIFLAVQVAESLPDRFAPPVEGLFKVNFSRIPPSDSTKEECDDFLASTLLTKIPNGVQQTPGKSVAIVMVHGWQALGGILKGQIGDSTNIPAHCSTWLQVMMAFRNQGGNWATLRQDADLYSFRYNSDNRILTNGTILKDEILEHLDNYSNIILLGHSMGGIVSVEARKQLNQQNSIGIVSINSPYMGATLLCGAKVGQVCTVLGTFRNATILTPLIALTGNYNGTLDLSSYYSRGISVGNPYLRNLWSDRSNFNRIYAIHGDNNSSLAKFGLPALLWVKDWGANDGIVPVASAVGAFTFTKDPYPSAVDKGLPNAVVQGRDHIQGIQGCPECSDYGSNPNYDQKMDSIAFGLKSFLPQPSGSLDTTFGGDGIVTTPIGSRYGNRAGAALDSNGKIVVVGDSYNGSNDDFVVVRYNSDGTLDTSFGGDGIVTTAIGDFDDRATSVVLDASGKIIVAGWSYIVDDIFQDYQFAVVRYNRNGSLDTSFGGDGIVTTAPEGQYGGLADSVTIDANGKIVVVGIGLSDFAIVRYNSNGTLDTSFGGDGIVITQVLFESRASSVVTDASGKIVVVGTCNNGFTLALVRYNSDGTLDSDFGDNGIIIQNTGGFYQWGRSVVLDADGKIVVAGFDNLMVLRYTNSGRPDNSFGVNGMVNIPGRAYSVTIDTNNRLVVGGHNGASFAVVRYNSNGTLDTSFDKDGIVNTLIGTRASARSVVLDTSGKIMLAGFSYNGSNYDFAVARYNP
jgi:uncharacterized delta-60 repeat protein